MLEAEGWRWSWLGLEPWSGHVRDRDRVNKREKGD